MVHCHEMHWPHCRNAELRIKMCRCVVIQRPFSNVVTSVIFSEAHLVVCFSFVLIVHLKNKSTNCRFVSLVSVYIYLQYTSTLDPL